MQRKRKVSTCQILHACTLFPSPITIYINGIKWVESLGFGEITQSFEVANESLDVAVANSMKPEKIWWKSVINPQKLNRFTLAVTEKNNMPCLTLFRDDPKPVAGRTKLRLVQLSPDVDPISIASERQVLFSDVSFGEARFLTFLPYSSALHVCRSTSDQKMFRVPELHFQSGASYTLFIVGKKSEKPDFRLLLLKSDKEE